MRIVSLFVALCFSLNVMASTGTVQELERVLDNYYYGLSVEWDQKDQQVYDSKTNEFFKKLESLIKDKGLTREELLTLVEKKANNKKVVDAIKLKMSLLQNGSSHEDLARLIKESAKDMYANGASWNGEIVFNVTVGLLIAAVIGYYVWYDANYDCVAWEERYSCTSYSCSSYTYGGSCYGGSYQTCGWSDVCTEYVKK